MRKEKIHKILFSQIIIISLTLFFNFVFSQIPYEEGSVYVCPLATKKEEINPKCPCRIDLILDETVTSTCFVNGKSYEMTLKIADCEREECYAILGFENGGAGVNFFPQAKIVAPSEGYVGKEILFDGSQSFDPNEDPLDFYWNFGDGNSDIREKPIHIYQNPGEYLVTLIVNDGMASSSTTAKIKIFPPKTSFFGGFLSFGTEKKITEEKKLEENHIQEISQPEKITKILKIEKPKEEKEIKGEIPESKNEIKKEAQIQSQNFFPLFLANLKEAITSPSTIILSIFLVPALIFVLLREIKMLKRK